MKLKLTCNIEEMFEDKSFQDYVESCIHAEITHQLETSKEFRDCINRSVRLLSNRLIAEEAAALKPKKKAKAKPRKRVRAKNS